MVVGRGEMRWGGGVGGVGREVGRGGLGGGGGGGPRGGGLAGGLGGGGGAVRGGDHGELGLQAVCGTQPTHVCVHGDVGAHHGGH